MPMGLGMDFGLLLFLAPAMLLAMWAQGRVQSTYARAMQVPAPLSGAAAARHILDRAGLENVEIEEVGGTLSDHYDPTHRVLRLSHEVYRSRSAAAVGIAAHEAGHAIQHATHYGPLVVRNLAVPLAQWGPNLAVVAMMAGFAMQSFALIVAGIVLFSGLAFFQLINLPVEFDASARAKRLLDELGLVDAQGAAAVKSVLGAAAWTYVAATLQTVLQVLYYVIQLMGSSRRSDRE
jgi:Zn-dependent membrane protease YugP